MSFNNIGARNRSDAVNSRSVNQDNQKKLEADKTTALFIRSDSKIKPTPNGKLSQSLSKIGSKCRDAMSHIATKLSKQKPVEFKLATSHVKSPELNATKFKPLSELPSAEVKKENTKKQFIHSSARLLAAVFPGEVKKFTEIRASRESDPETYRLYQNFAREVGEGDNVDFLAAMDDLKVDSSSEKIRLILNVFIKQDEEDMLEFNPFKSLTVEGQNKKTINLSSSEVRKELISALNSKLNEKAGSQQHKEMVELLVPIETYIANNIDGNAPRTLSHELKALRLQNAATASAPINPQMLA